MQCCSRMEPGSPRDAFSGMLDDEKDSDGETVEHMGGPSKVEVNVEFAREAVDRSRARQLARKLPKSLVNLSKRNVLPPSHVKRIIAAESMTEEFGANRIWCCKKCAMKFNQTASEVFDWSDKRKVRPCRLVEDCACANRNVSADVSFCGVPG